MPEPVVYGSAAELVASVGSELGPTDWTVIESAAVARFGSVTGAAEDTVSPFLLLSLIPSLAAALRRLENVRMGVNYGLDGARFGPPVPAGARVRIRTRLLSAKPIGESSVQSVNRVTIEVDGRDEPACTAEMVSRHHF